MNAIVISYDPHATLMMQARGLTEADVRTVLTTGWDTKEWSSPGRDRRYGRRGVIGRRGPIGQTDVKVVWIWQVATYYVISAQWIWLALPRREDG